MPTQQRTDSSAPVALITGGSRGLGRALTVELLDTGWRVVTDGRDRDVLAQLVQSTAYADRLTTVPGDVSDPGHRTALLAAVAGLGRLDLLVNNASLLGPSPQPMLADYPLDTLAEVYAVNVVAPLALSQLALPHLRRSAGRILNVSSDAAVEPYPGWGGYGSSKAALDQVSAILAAENPDLRIYAVDPGDMRTDMHAAAFPGEDISDRPSPDTVLPALARLIHGDVASGRYRAAALVEQVSA